MGRRGWRSFGPSLNNRLDRFIRRNLGASHRQLAYTLTLLRNIIFDEVNVFFKLISRDAKLHQVV